MTLSAIILILFIAMSIAHMVFESKDSRVGRYATKPLLMPLLALYYITSTSEMNALVIAAISCGWLGDIFLMMSPSNRSTPYFKLGLSAFLVGNICYMILFSKYLSCVTGIPVWGWACLATYIGAGIVGCRLIIRHTGNMKPAVTTYIAVIALMGTSTVFPLGCVHKIGAVTTMTGALIFMVSDGINAYHRFIGKVPWEWMLTMGTYLTGQFLIVQGYLLF